jgi:manganese efflux pump family protein
VTFATILLLAVGLSMDATAVAAARGLAAERIRTRDVLLIAALFGGFQALMPLAGWLIGTRLGPYIAEWDHWIAFALLAAIGGKMLWEARGGGAKIDGQDTFAVPTLVILAIATSIDAFAAGITLPTVGAPLSLSLVTIGTTTAVLSAAGLFAGRRLGATIGRKLDVAGGLILIALGVKILVEHLAA